MIQIMISPGCAKKIERELKEKKNRPPTAVARVEWGPTYSGSTQKKKPTRILPMERQHRPRAPCGAAMRCGATQRHVVRQKVMRLRHNVL